MMRAMSIPAFSGSLVLATVVIVSMGFTQALQAQNARAPGPAAATAPNEYFVYCNSPNLDGPIYFSDIFAFNATTGHANAISAVLAAPFLQFLEKKYAVKVASSFYTSASWSGSNFPTQCSQSYESLQQRRSDKQRVETT